MKVNNELDCPNCKDRYDEPKILPCGCLICNYCITTLTITNELKCPQCNTNHQIPESGFTTCQTINKLLNQKPEISKAKQDLKSNLEQMTNKLKQAEFDLANGDYVIIEHCRELRLEVQLAKEILIQEINQVSDTMMSHIDTFQSDSIESYTKVNKTLIDTQLKEIKKSTEDCIKLVEQPETNDTETEIANKQIKDLQSVLAIQTENIKSVTFSRQNLEYSKKRTELSKDILGKLKYKKLDLIDMHSLDQVDLSDDIGEERKCIFEMINHDYNSHLKISEFSSDFFENGEFVIAYTERDGDSTIRIYDPDFNSCKQQYELEHPGFKGFRVCRNRMAFIAENSEIKRPELTVMNQSLVIVHKTLAKNQKIVGFSEESIFCYINSKKIQSTIVVYNWQLKKVKTIGQKLQLTDPFYFTSNLTRLELKFDKYYFFDCRTGVNYLQIMDEKLGTIIRSVLLSDDAQELRIDSENNILVLNDDDKMKSLSYYNLNGDFLKEVQMKNFPMMINSDCLDYTDLFAFDAKNKLYFFEPATCCLYY